MDINHRKEQFSRAYVRAIAAVAGFGTGTPEPDHDSIDLVFFKKSEEEAEGRNYSAPRVEAQLKCTAQNVIRAGALHFPLEAKNYNELRRKVLVPRILVVHCIPSDIAEWLEHSEQQLLLRHCSYWVSLRDLPLSTNATRVTVQVPQANKFTPQALSEIMERISRGELP